MCFIYYLTFLDCVQCQHFSTQKNPGLIFNFVIGVIMQTDVKVRLRFGTRLISMKEEDKKKKEKLLKHKTPMAAITVLFLFQFFFSQSLFKKVVKKIPNKVCLLLM